MEIKVYEISIKLQLLKDIEYKDSYTEISNFIDTALAKEKEWLKLHNTNTFKNYVFNSLYPVDEKDKRYISKKRYTIIIRTIDKELALFLSKICDHTTDIMICKKVTIKIVKHQKIEKLYSITPVIIKNNEYGYWKNNITIDEYKKKLTDNLIKKYNMFTKTKIDEDFTVFEKIGFENKMCVSFKYKNIKLLGDKVDLTICDNEKAQLLAYMALGTGIGEMNARGAGFLNYKEKSNTKGDNKNNGK